MTTTSPGTLKGQSRTSGNLIQAASISFCAPASIGAIDNAAAPLTLKRFEQMTDR